MSNILQLIPNNALAVDQDQLAARIREFADRIEAGQFGEVERVALVIDSPTGVDYRVYGRQCCAAELVGLMEWCKARIIRGDN
ncbi:hypothetical protein I5U59_09335 [Stenotrophomonas maltophilia]|uniref:hypothetical protein n=1 Tax=Stenotrophomonas maltophilia TaxID=40324 RepID=UPI0013DD3072|nr:hypothetical protein [Stenotrophomonas maltophilia]MBH1476979.1 hypothetical protein [Stenotrophomonas maltophilia]MBH1503278.1 hypothetical protein [Stenotrophomonas maltophilia]